MRGGLFFGKPKKKFADISWILLVWALQGGMVYTSEHTRCATDARPMRATVWNTPGPPGANSADGVMLSSGDDGQDNAKNAQP